MKAIFKSKLGTLLFFASVGSLVTLEAFSASSDHISLDPVPFIQPEECGSVNIVSILAGPRHGSMMQVSNSDCGRSYGWICLDPDGTYLSSEKGKRMYAFILAQYLAKEPVNLTVKPYVYAAACNGAFPVVEDVRTP